MLSDYSDWMLIEYANKLPTRRNAIQQQAILDFDNELDLHQPDEATYHFGDCAGQSVFLPIEEYDSKGQLIENEVVMYDEEGEQVWN